MGPFVQKQIEVFRIPPVAFWATIFVAVLLQAVMPVKVPLARLFDFPLLVTIYFALVRRNKIFGIFLGTGLGLLQDALSHGFIGIFGMAKAVVGYLATSASVKFDLEHIVARLALTGVFILLHSLLLQGIQHGLLESPPPFELVELLISVLVNVALALILFQVLDRFKQPA